MTNGPLIDGIENIPGVGLPTWVRFQLGSRHYPPIHPDFDATAIAAIESAAKGEYDTELFLPNGRLLTVFEVIDQLHLHPLVEFYAEAEAEAAN